MYYYRYLKAGEVATKATLDDREPLSVVRGTSQTVNNSTVFVNDTVLLLPLAADATYHVSAIFVVSGPQLGEWKRQWSAPSGAAGTCFSHGPSSGATTVRSNDVNFRSVPLTTTINFNTDGSENSAIREEIWLTTSGTAGNLQLTWAQVTATVGSTTIHPGSFMSAYRVV